ncbi:MAG: putative bifunctional diguanylate cyclase/phosphodiesterase, partial [Acidimicrobiia bacterium]
MGGVDAAQVLDAVFRRARVGMAIADVSGRLLDVNDAMCRFLGYTADQLTTMSFRDITATGDLAGSGEGLRQLVDRTATDFVLEKRYVTATGEHVWGLVTGVGVYDVDGSLARVIAQIEDLSERKLAEAAISHRNTYDDLTGLANRAAFEERLQAALAQPRRSARRLALLVVNLDRFHQVNAGLGRAAADIIVIEVARRLRAVTRGHDTIGRLGGDEFAILAPGIASTEDAVGLAIDIRRVLGEPHWPAGNAVFVSARVGVVTAPADGADAETLVRKATSAADTARSFTSGWAIHQPGDDATSRDELALVSDLRTALANHALTIAYQPVVDAHGIIHHVEALARWHHSERGAVPPEQFIVVAEQNGLIDTLTIQILTGAIEQAARWDASGQPVAIAVNLSGRLLADPTLVQQTTHLLDRAGLPAERLTLEITESALADGTNPAISAALDSLRSLGVRISIDDFGTGYSSLAYLKQLPIDELKIDRSFITDFDADPRTGRIVRSIINLAHSLDLAIVA